MSIRYMKFENTSKWIELSLEFFLAFKPENYLNAKFLNTRTFSR